MNKKEVLLVLVIAIFIVTPAVLSLSAYVLTKNPSLRPLGITEEQLAEAGQLSQKGLIIAVVDIGEFAQNALPKSSYDKALKTTFNRLGSEVRVKFRTIPKKRDVKITYIVGESIIGPFPAAKASAGVHAALQAEKATAAHRKALSAKQAKNDEFKIDGFLEKLFN